MAPRWCGRWRSALWTRTRARTHASRFALLSEVVVLTTMSEWRVASSSWMAGRLRSAGVEGELDEEPRRLRLVLAEPGVDGEGVMAKGSGPEDAC